jgi:hypothetical protein
MGITVDKHAFIHTVYIKLLPAFGTISYQILAWRQIDIRVPILEESLRVVCPDTSLSLSLTLSFY